MSSDVQLCVQVLGTVFTVQWGRSVAAAQRQAMRAAWSRCLVQPTSSVIVHHDRQGDGQGFTASIYYESKVTGAAAKHLRSLTIEGLAEMLTSEITLAAILERAGELTMLHACGVAHSVTGAVVALVARSGTGKTTASAVLGRQLSYITDETVAIRPDGSVVPYPKPLSVKQADGGAKLQLGPDALGLLPAPKRPFISAIVLLDRVTEAEPLQPVLAPVALADAVLALIPETSSQSAMDEPLRSLCQLIDRVGGVWRMKYSEAEDLAAALSPLLEINSGRAPSEPAQWSRPIGETDAGVVPAGLLRRTSPADAVEIEGDLLLLSNSEVIRLSGIAPAMWRAAAQPLSMEELVCCIADIHGLTDGHEAIVQAAVDALLAKGILVRGSNG